MDTKDKIEKCLEVLESVKGFNSDFLNNLLDNWYVYHDFTPAQEKAVNNIYYRYKVNSAK